MNERPLGMAWLEGHPRLHSFYMRYVSVIVAAIFVVITVSACGVVWLTFQRGNDSQRLIAVNQQNAVVSCQNANESRHATLALWNFIFGLSNPNASAQQKADSAKILGWIRMIYRDRDCSDLSKKYPLPDPPVIGKSR